MKLVKTGRLYIGCLSLLAPAFVFAQTPITTNESPESHAKRSKTAVFGARLPIKSSKLGMPIITNYMYH